MVKMATLHVFLAASLIIIIAIVTTTMIVELRVIIEV